MNNQQIAELFSMSAASFDKSLPLDYRDRAVELALYFNETIEDDKEAENAVEAVRWAMMLAYSGRFNLDLSKAEEEEVDPNTSAETLPSN